MTAKLELEHDMVETNAWVILHHIFGRHDVIGVAFTEKTARKVVGINPEYLSCEIHKIYPEGDDTP